VLTPVLVCVDDTSNPEGQAIYLGRVTYIQAGFGDSQHTRVACHLGDDPGVYHYPEEPDGGIGGISCTTDGP
jgi:hypothetical protein